MPEEVFFCTELTPWRPGLTPKGMPVVHADAFSSRLPGADWIDKRCPVCLWEWAEDGETKP